MKKLTLFLVGVLSMMCLSMPVSATYSETQYDNESLTSEWEMASRAQAEKVSEAAAYAYMDLESASDEMKEKILAARETIIYSQGWVADGFSAVVTRADGTVESLPTFSELFPEWEMPDVEVTQEELENSAVTFEDSIAQPMSASYYWFYPYLRNPSDSVNTSPFCSYTHYGSYVTTYVSSLSASENCNIGYSNTSTGKSLGYQNNLAVGESITLYTLYSGSIPLGIRASTFSTPGYSTMLVEDDVFDGTIVSTGDLSR